MLGIEMVSKWGHDLKSYSHLEMSIANIELLIHWGLYRLNCYAIKNKKFNTNGTSRESGDHRVHLDTLSIIL